MEGAGWQGSERVSDFSSGLMNTLPVTGLPITGLRSIFHHGTWTNNSASNTRVQINAWTVSSRDSALRHDRNIFFSFDLSIVVLVSNLRVF